MLWAPVVVTLLVVSLLYVQHRRFLANQDAELDQLVTEFEDLRSVIKDRPVVRPRIRPESALSVSRTFSVASRRPKPRVEPRLSDTVPPAVREFIIDAFSGPLLVPRTLHIEHSPGDIGAAWFQVQGDSPLDYLIDDSSGQVVKFARLSAPESHRYLDAGPRIHTPTRAV